MIGGRFIWVASLLIALNLLVGGLSFSYLTRVEGNYTRLINESVPFLNSMRTATAQSARTYSLFFELSQAGTPAEIARLETEIAAQRAVTDRIFSSPLNERAVPPELRPMYDDIIRTRATSLGRRTSLIELAQAGRAAEAQEYMRVQMIPAQRDYLSKLDAFCVRYEDRVELQMRDLTEANLTNRLILIGLAALPVLLSVAFFLIALISILAPLNNLVRNASVSKPPPKG